MSRMTGGRAIVESVLRQGVEVLFGLPGAQLYDLYEALYGVGDRVRLITARHEQGAAYMALGYAHSTGRVGAYAVVPGPGVLNTTAALATAWGCNARVLCLTGEIPSDCIGRGLGHLHELPDQRALMRGLTKSATRIERPEDAPRLVEQAFTELHTGRPRPVELEMAWDVMGREAEVQLLEPAPVPAPPEPDPEAIERAAMLLGRAHKPLIMVGGGAVEAAGELGELARVLQAPVVAHRQGRGLVDERHWLSQSYPAGHRLWAEADAVLAVGTRLMDPLTRWGTGGLDIVRVDIDPEEPARVEPPAVPIVADARATLTALLPALERHNRARDSREAELTALKHTMHQRFSRLQPQLAFLEAIRDELPEDGIFVDEITQVGFASWFAFPVYGPRRFISSGYQGTLGYGFATALGVQIAHPEQKVVHVAGDGGFMYNAQELATAVRLGLPLVTIVFRDDRFGNVHRDQKEHYAGHTIGTELHNPDFVALAQSFGAAGLRARDAEELRGMLRRAFDQRGPALIEVPVGEMPSPWEFIMMPRVRPARGMS